MRIPPKIAFQLFNFWPPFFGAGISVKKISADMLSMETHLKNRFWTKSLLGLQFGGSIYSMTDPIYVAIISSALGSDYVVMDKEAKIAYTKAGKGKLIAKFQLTEVELNSIKNNTENGQPYIFEKSIEVTDESNRQIAKIDKKIYIRKLKK